MRVRVLDGLDSADTHHTSNSFALDPGGAVYFQEGTFHHTQVETPYGPPVRNANAGVYPLRAAHAEVRGLRHLRLRQPARPRLGPLGPGLSSTTAPGPTPITARSSPATSTSPASTRTRRRSTSSAPGPAPASRSSPAGTSPRRTRATCWCANVIGFQGILQYKLAGQRAPASTGTEVEPIVSSSDPNFRPSDIKIGPDGAIYFLDWQNPIIGHMQHNLRDPSRDRTHGRIYRVTYEGRDLLKPAEDRRRADRQAARPAQGAGGPRPLPGQDRAGRPQDRGGDRRREEVGRPISTRRTRNTSTT